MGMFWRFGSFEERRPVEATAWWKVVCRRPVAGSSSAGRASTYVDFSFVYSTPVEQHRDHRVGRAQLLEDGGVRGEAGLRALAAGQVELVEQDLLELLGAAEVELVADRVVDVLLEPRDDVAELAGQLAQRLPVDGDAGGLEVGEDRDERQLELVEDAAQARLAVEGRGERPRARRRRPRPGRRRRPAGPSPTAAAARSPAARR